VIAVAQEIPKQSFAQQSNATTTQSSGQNASSLTQPLQQGNQSIIKSQGNATTLSLNITTIPLQTSTIEIRTITKSVDSRAISQLSNVTLTNGTVQLSHSMDLSDIKNQTLTVPTGKAISTIITRTDVPYNITTLQLTSGFGQNQTTVIPAFPETIDQLFKITPSLQPSTSTNQTTGTAVIQNNSSAAH
jgi:hypothetical protein